MSVAKNTLVSGSREKSLEIMVLRPPPQAARTGVCDGPSSSRRSSALTSPTLMLRSSPFPGLRCPVNVQPSLLFYTDSQVLHRSHETLRQHSSASKIGAPTPSNSSSNLRHPLDMLATKCYVFSI